MITRLLKDTTGTTAIEYGLIVALVTTGTIGLLQAISGTLIAALATIATKF